MVKECPMTWLLKTAPDVNDVNIFGVETGTGSYKYDTCTYSTFALIHFYFTSSKITAINFQSWNTHAYHFFQILDI